MEVFVYFQRIVPSSRLLGQFFKIQSVFLDTEIVFNCAVLQVVEEKIQQEEKKREEMDPGAFSWLGMEAPLYEHEQGWSTQELEREWEFMNMDHPGDVAWIVQEDQRENYTQGKDHQAEVHETGSWLSALHIYHKTKKKSLEDAQQYK